MKFNSSQSMTPSSGKEDQNSLGHRQGPQREKPLGVRFAIHTRVCDWDKKDTSKFS